MDRSFSPQAGALLTALALFAAGCSGPADQKLVTGQGLDAYKASLAPVAAKLSAEEKAAFDWAVSDFDLAKLNARYPDASVRDVIRGEVREVESTYPARIAELEARAKAEAPVRAQIDRVRAGSTSFFVDRNFFGLQPKVRARITNGSNLPISSLDWRAALYIDDQPTPAATTVVTNDYRNQGGLKPGDVFNATFTIGFVRGDESWTTLAIRNARTTRVVLEPVPDSVKDFSNRAYLPTDTRSELERLRAGLQLARKYASL